MAKIPEELINDIRKYILEHLNLTENDGVWVDDFTFQFHEPVHEISMTIKTD